MKFKPGEMLRTTVMEAVTWHSVEVLGDPRQRSGRIAPAIQSPHRGFDRHYLDSARQSSAHRHDAWACGRMADSLHAMAVRVQHKRAVVVGMILWSQPRRTTVASATGKRRRIKSVYRPAIGSAKTQVRARNWSFDFAFLGDRKFDTERTRCSTIVRASVLAEVNDAYKPERA